MQEHSKESFWDERAGTFPRYEAGEDTYEARMLGAARKLGAVFRGRSVLDVGCGSGMYTLRIAGEAERVTALDISAEMLRLMREDAQRLGLGNIEYVHSTWDDFKGKETYDVVFCSMTPAIGSEESRLKLLDCAHGQTVFMGFAAPMSSDMLNPLFEKYGVTPRIFNNGPEMRQWLENRGIPCKSRVVEGQWVQERGREETIQVCTSMMGPYSVTPDRAFLEEHVEAFRTGEDTYVEHTDYKVELLLWESPEGN